MRKLLFIGTIFQSISWAIIVILYTVHFNDYKVWLSIISAFFMVGGILMTFYVFGKNTAAFLLKYQELIDAEKHTQDVLAILRQMMLKIGSHEGTKLTEEELEDIEKLKRLYKLK